MKLLAIQGFHSNTEGEKNPESTVSTKMNKSARSMKKIKKELKEIQEAYKETGKVRKSNFW